MAATPVVPDLHRRPVHEGRPRRRLVVVVRADPVICGHSGEARNLAETAVERGFDDVRIVTWPLGALEASGLPLKPLDGVLDYSPGITVERPAPVGDYKVPDGRWTAGIVGRLVELFTDGVPTVCLSLYLHPHTSCVVEAVRIARATGLPVRVTTIAEAVGSDVTNVVRTAVDRGAWGAAAATLATYLANDHVVAVSDYTRRLILQAAATVDAALGTSFAGTCETRVRVSYPAVDTDAFLDPDPLAVDRACAARGLESGRYVLFLSRLTPAKGVDDLIDGYRRAACRHLVPLVVAGTGPAAAELRAQAGRAVPDDGTFVFLDDVGDAEKRLLMAGCAAYALPSKPRPEFVETFGIALVEQMLSGGGPVITTATGGIPEAVGDTAYVVPAGDPVAIARALDDAVLELDAVGRRVLADKARAHALAFDRRRVFDALLAPVAVPVA